MLSLSRILYMPEVTDKIKNYFLASTSLVQKEISEIEVLKQRVLNLRFEGYKDWIEKLDVAKAIAQSGVSETGAEEESPQSLTDFATGTLAEMEAQLV